jgi:hypothetical protein
MNRERYFFSFMAGTSLGSFLKCKKLSELASVGFLSYLLYIHVRQESRDFSN